MFKKIILGLLALIVVLGVIGFVYIQSSWDKTYDIAYPDLKVSNDSDVIARGEYLVKGPSHCVHCHVNNVDQVLEAEATGNVALVGGLNFPLGPVATLYPPNLTPDEKTGIGRYEDGAVFRMMRHAVKPDGTVTVPPLMPFYNLADEDLVAIVSYLKAQEPVVNEVKPAEYSFLGKFVRTINPLFKPIEDPQNAVTAPPMEATVERGEYLARYAANCVGCHTSVDLESMKFDGPEFAGGSEFLEVNLNQKFGMPANSMTRSPNLTTHETGVLNKFPSVDDWIARFRKGRAVQHSPMPWGAFSRMTDEDLGALYAFLKSLDPVDYDPGPVVFAGEE